MATKDTRKPIEINNLQNGVAQTPYVGISSIVNLDVSKSGSIIMNNIPVLNALSIDGLPKWMAVYNSTYFLLTSVGKVYQSNDAGITWVIVSGNDLTRASGNGMEVYQGNLYVARDTYLDKCTLSTGVWTNSYQTLSLGALRIMHMMLVGQDDILYIANGRYIASLNGTSWNATALDLPTGYEITCLAELGTELLAGTLKNTKDSADIFPWDRVSPSFNLPVRIGENGVYQMINKDNSIYAVCGDEYIIYNTNGTTAIKVASLADYLRPISDNYNPHFTLQTIGSGLSDRGSYDASTNLFPSTGGSGTSGTIKMNDSWVVSVSGTLGGTFADVGYIVIAKVDSPGQVTNNWNVVDNNTSLTPIVSFYPGAIDTYKNKILFGVNIQIASDDGRYPFGIWSYDGSKFQLENIPSSGLITNTSDLQIGMIYPLSNSSYLFSWKQGATIGLDLVNNNGYFHSNYEPFFESELMRVGTNKVPYTFQEMEVIFGKKLRAGQGIRIKYRKDLGSTWTLHTTIDYTTKGAIHSTYVPFGVTSDLIQFRVEFTTNGSDISCPELVSIRLT